MNAFLKFAFIISVIACNSNAAVSIFGPIPYRQRSDSPFYAGILSNTIYLEDFEDSRIASLDVGIRPGGIIQNDQGVDEDDGSVDGRGENAVWFWASQGSQGLPEY